MFAQRSAFFDNAFSKYQCGFRKGYSTQQFESVRKMEQTCRQRKSFWCFINRPLN